MLSAQPARGRPASITRARKSLLRSLISPTKSGSSSILRQEESQHLSPVKETESPSLPSPLKENVGSQQPSSHLSQGKIVTPRKRTAAEALCQLAETTQVLHPSKIQATNEGSWSVSNLSSSPQTLDICGVADPTNNVNIQVEHSPEVQDNHEERRSISPQTFSRPTPAITQDSIVKRSKAVMANLKQPFRSKWVQCQRSPIKKCSDTASSPIKPSKLPVVPRPCQKAPSTADSVVSYDESTSLSTDELSGSSYRPSGEASSGGSSSGLGAFKKTSIRELHLKRVKADPMYYIGIKPEYYYLVDQFS